MPPAPRALCAYCRRLEAVPAWRPFCSERCKLLDLARWVDGEYRIAGDTVAPDAADPDQPAPTDS
jgi:endogenous inhibitor of DNA gyrase (YacG/DUF329 family)